MNVISSFRQAALALPLLAAVLFAGVTITSAAHTAKSTTVSTLQLADKPAPKDSGTVHADGSMVAWAG